MLHKHPCELMCLKQNSGISRGGYHRGDKVTNREAKAMSAEDAWRIRLAEDRLNGLQLDRYKDFSEDMTPEQIREKLERIAQENPSRLNSLVDFGFTPQDIDGSYAPAKNAKYQKLVDALNGLDFSQMPGVKLYDEVNFGGTIATIPGHEYMGRRGRTYIDYDSFYIGIARQLTSGYSTRELGEFVKEELGRKNVSGGRDRYITSLALDLSDRVRSGYSVNDDGLRRLRLSEPSTRVDAAVRHIQGIFSDARMYRGRMAEVRAKYKK